MAPIWLTAPSTTQKANRADGPGSAAPVIRLTRQPQRRERNAVKKANQRRAERAKLGA